MKLIGSVILLCATTAMPAGTRRGQQASASPSLPEGAGKVLVESQCVQCHTLERVVSAHNTKAQWQSTISDMVDKGADLGDDEIATVVAYLTKNYGPESGASASAVTKPEDELPDGAAKAIVIQVCTECHSLARVVNSNYSKTGWKGTIDDMVGRGADLSDEDVAAVTAYLAANFGKDATVHINQASSKLLQQNLGVTLEQADAIVAYREKNGPFAQWQDLEKVAGLDSKTIESWKDRLAF